MTDVNWNATVSTLLAEYAENQAERAEKFAAALESARREETWEGELAELENWGAEGFAFTGELAPGEIVAALDVMGRDGFELPDVPHEWFEELDTMTSNHGTGAVLSMALFMQANSMAGVDSIDFDRAFGSHYRQQWDTPGAWARQEAAGRAEMGHGTMEEANAAAAELGKWADFIDWERVAADGDLDEGYTMVQPDDDGPVYVFIDEV